MLEGLVKGDNNFDNRFIDRQSGPENTVGYKRWKYIEPDIS
jgi:hypothetical protein